MGIYIFNRQVLSDCLDNDLEDFGKHIIPAAIGSRNVQAHIFRGYWEDIGTIRSFLPFPRTRTSCCGMSNW